MKQEVRTLFTKDIRINNFIAACHKILQHIT